MVNIFEVSIKEFYTLVGSTSIFISLNSQHKIQYVREILWDLISIPYNFDENEKQAIGKKIFNKIWLYKDITERQTDFAVTIKVARASLFIIIFIWITLGLLLFKKYYLVDFIYIATSIIASSAIVMGFIYVLGQISNITKIGNLPSIDEILDASCLKTGVNTITLAAMSIRLGISQIAEEKMKFTIGLPVPFNNFLIKPLVNATGDTSDKIQLIFDEYDYLIKIENYNAKWNLGSSLLWYDILEINIQEIRELGIESKKIQVQLGLHSEQGLVHVQFFIPVNEINIDNLYPTLFYPDYFHEIAMENTSNFAPWSIQRHNPGDDAWGP